MGVAVFWGALGASALLVGALLAYLAKPGPKVVGLVMALGSGLLIGSVSFELIDEAVKTAEVPQVGLVTLIGALVFTLGDVALRRWSDRSGPGPRTGTRTGASSARSDSPAVASGSETGDGGTSLAIVFGSVLDGIPESFVLGLTVVQGGVSVALLVAVILSNLPEGISSSSGLRDQGWPMGRVLLMWAAVVAASAVAAGLGYAVLDPDQGQTGALVQAFAAGALLAMVADTMLPESFKVEGALTGTLVVAGFAIALGLSAA